MDKQDTCQGNSKIPDYKQRDIEAEASKVILIYQVINELHVGILKILLFRTILLVLVY